MFVMIIKTTYRRRVYLNYFSVDGNAVFFWFVYDS